jgi:hypothetical protein
MHCDSSCYGWGAALNEQLEARGFLVTCISTATHHVEGVEGRATRSPFVPTAITRTKSTSARRESSSSSFAQTPHVPVANHDVRTSEIMGTHRHQQHQYLRALYSIRNKRVGRKAQLRNIHGRHVAQPPHLHLPRLTLPPPTPSRYLPRKATRSFHATMLVGEAQPPKP